MTTRHKCRTYKPNKDEAKIMYLTPGEQASMRRMGWRITVLSVNERAIGYNPHTPGGYKPKT